MHSLLPVQASPPKHSNGFHGWFALTMVGVGWGVSHAGSSVFLQCDGRICSWALTASPTAAAAATTTAATWPAVGVDAVEAYRLLPWGYVDLFQMLTRLFEYIFDSFFCSFFPPSASLLFSLSLSLYFYLSLYQWVLMWRYLLWWAALL